MDPISIAQVVSGAAGVAQSAWKVYELIKNARKVDETVRQMQAELKQVSDTCNLVQNKINKTTNDQELLKSINTQVETCSTVVNSISSKIVGNKKSSVFTQVFRQLKLDMDETEINKCRSRIQISLLNLQLSLQLVNVQASYIGPRQVDDLFLSCLKNIQTTLDAHGEKLDKALRQRARSCISDANTVYSESTQGSVVGADSKVGKWLSELSIIDELSIQSGIDDDVYESDNSLDIELANSIHSTAQVAFEARDYKKAESSFRECLRSIKALSKAKQREFHLQIIRVRLAIIAYHLYDSVVAEEALANAITAEIAHQDLKFEAMQCLVAVYAKRNKLDLAAATCENLYRSQRKIYGKDQRAYQSLAWLARIYDLQGNYSRATAYQGLIPTTIRDLRDWDSHLIPAQLHPPEPFADEDIPIDLGYTPCTWSHDNKLLAFETYSPELSIAVRQVSTGKLVHSLQYSHGHSAKCIAFDELDSKLVAGIHNHIEDWIRLKVWDAKSGSLLRTIDLIDGATESFNPHVCDFFCLRFLPGSARIISAYRWLLDSRELAIHDTNTGSKMATLSLKHNLIQSVIVVKDNLFSIGYYDVMELDTNLQSIDEGRDQAAFGFREIVAATRSPVGSLTIAYRDGGFASYHQGELITLDFKFPKADDARMFCIYMQYNRHQTLIVLIQMRDGPVILGAPALNKWKELRGAGVIHLTMGLSPDAVYAFYVTQGTKDTILKAVLVSKYLSLPPYS